MSSRVAVVLAAGKGTRMGGDRPKVLYRVAGRPMLLWVLEAARAAGAERSVVVVGHGADEVEEAVVEAGVSGVSFALQEPQNGTGHALAQARQVLADDEEALLLVLSGDVPLVSGPALERLAAAAGSPGTWGAMAVADLAEPGSLGRVIPAEGEPDGARALDRIVEASDATPDELRVTLINAGIYALPAPAIWGYLDRLGTANAQGELYLTDALGDAAHDGRRIVLHTLEDPSEATGVNTREELARADRLLESRLASALERGA